MIAQVTTVGGPSMLNHLPLSSTPGHTPLALLVDRDVDTRRLYGEYLRTCSCAIEEAEDGREALAKAISQRPELVVTETRLAGINGYELCQLLRRDEATRGAAIVFVTGDAFDGDARRAEASGADAVLIKPCLPERLEAEIRRVMRRSTEMAEQIRILRQKSSEQLARANQLVDLSRTAQRNRALSRAFDRRRTTQPPLSPPPLTCPVCDRQLSYLDSHIGGVNERHAEQWDDFECASGCGAFQYRHRTRKLRRVN